MRPLRAAALALLGLLSPASLLLAQEGAESASERSEAPDPVTKLEQEFERAQQAFFEKREALEDEAARQRLFEEEYPRPEVWAAKFLEVARAHPDTELEARALAWVAGALPSDDERRAEALRTLAERHIDSPELGDVCLDLTYETSDEVRGFLRRVAADSPLPEVRGKALFALGFSYKRSSDRGDPQALAEAERIFEQVRREYADVEGWGGTLGELAGRNLFEIRNLAIGKVAPEIEGEDVDGVPFRLSDYRGKVVLLDFWGDW